MTRARRSFKRPAPDTGEPFLIAGTSRRVRWCERPDSYFRPMGFCDEVIQAETGFRPRDMGEGWYCSPDNETGEVARGVVYRLPHGRGFVAGIADPCNDGPAMLAICEAPESSAANAARYADQLAEWYAEAERRYEEGWRDGQTAREAWRDALGEALAHVQAARTMRRAARVALRRALAQREGEAAGFVPPDVLAEARALYRRSLERSRAFTEAAFMARREARDAVRDRPASYRNDSHAEGWREGFAQ